MHDSNYMRLVYGLPVEAFLKSGLDFETLSEALDTINLVLNGNINGRPFTLKLEHSGDSPNSNTVFGFVLMCSLSLCNCRAPLVVEVGVPITELLALAEPFCIMLGLQWAGITVEAFDFQSCGKPSLHLVPCYEY